LNWRIGGVRRVGSPAAAVATDQWPLWVSVDSVTSELRPLCPRQRVGMLQCRNDAMCQKQPFTRLCFVEDAGVSASITRLQCSGHGGESGVQFEADRGRIMTQTTPDSFVQSDDWSDLSRHLTLPDIDFGRLHAHRVDRIRQSLTKVGAAMCVLVSPISLR